MLSVLTRAGHFLNADGTPHNPYHELHLPHDPPLYPTLDRVPHTTFSCEGRDWGLHADTEAYCQVNVPVMFTLGTADLSRAGTRGILPAEFLCIYVRVGGLLVTIACGAGLVTSRVPVHLRQCRGIASDYSMWGRACFQPSSRGI
jgi:hypothetical protein